MGRVSDNLAGRLHSVFDTRHAPVLALRIRHPDGAGWSVDGFVLEVSAPDLTVSVDLRTVTLREVSDHLLSLGFEVPHVALGHLSASLLIEGAGHQGDSNGDHLYAYTSLLSVLLGVLGRADGVARDDIGRALAQMILPDSGGEWADLFGSIFGIPRLSEEPDALYTARIIEEVKRARSSPPAILRNIRRLTGHELAVREPWMEIFELSGGALSDVDHLQGAPIYEYHRAQLISRHGIDWSGPVAVAQADRPAGTLFLEPAVWPLALHPNEPMVDGGAIAWRDEGRGIAARLFDSPRLSDNLILSANDADLRWETARIDVRGIDVASLRPADLTNDAGWSGLWDFRSWSDGLGAMEFYPPASTED